MTKILLTNYPRFYQEPTFEKVGGDREKLHFMCGYDIKVDKKMVTQQIASDLITAMLTYDTVFIKSSNVWDVFQVWGSEYFKELLRGGVLKVIPDQKLNPVMMEKNNKWVPDYFSYTSGIQDINNHERFTAKDLEWGVVETIFHKFGFKGSEANAILLLLDENKVNIDAKKVSMEAKKETYHDINTTEFVDKYNIMRVNSVGLREFHKQRLLRLHELNTTCVMAGMIGADGIKTDGNISQIMAYKMSTLPLEEKFPDGVSAIKKVTLEKGFPDLGKLFIDGIIDLDDIIKLRGSFQGKIFRYWSKLDNYEEKLFREDIMNSVHNVLGGKVSNATRFVLTNIIGFISNIPGVVASAIDSYVLDKIFKGWHPNFFLDDKLKILIDKSIEKHEKEERKEKIKQMFKCVRPNDPCPCGSGKKFKKCHGKEL